MKVTRLANAVPYYPPKHSVTTHVMYLQHKSLESDTAY